MNSSMSSKNPSASTRISLPNTIAFPWINFWSRPTKRISIQRKFFNSYTIASIEFSLRLTTCSIKFKPFSRLENKRRLSSRVKSTISSLNSFNSSNKLLKTFSKCLTFALMISHITKSKRESLIFFLNQSLILKFQFEIS